MMNDPAVTGTIISLLFIIVATVVMVLAIYLTTRKCPHIKIGMMGRTVLLIAAAVTGWMIMHSPLYSPQKVQRPHADDRERSDDAALLQMGHNLFKVHCAVCHGEDGDAPKGKGANLTRRISFESALLNIQRGANNFKYTFPGGMPPMISDRLRAAQVAHYVSSGFTENEEGKMLYKMINCARCHGEDGRGLKHLGPNIREFDLQTVELVLKNGKNGVIGKMPRFEQLNDEQIRALSLYVISFQKR